ncbi:pyruvate dehydrogenase (acetyl-transferring) E1 component subunit alpha [Candidatus Woesearchaeota archaeon]|nr:pyruvate dehydrogenase (acetyl-transferring) E1 component subunit alpha [Candidatus Woesearchaeota archaeon]|tara:strand:- start:4245 stop:5309 length:1065 start_codon:yes stop_codon:yes gene_type:complete
MVKKVIKNFEIEYLQVLDESGKIDEKLMPKLTDKQIKELYELMILARTFDDKGFNLQRQGRMGSFLQFKGQEASQVGTAYALEDKDWMFPMYRSGAALIARKYPIHMIYLYYGGDERGLKCPNDQNNFPISIPVGTQISHAPGCAWASKLKKEKDVTMVYFGDGASSKADFHEGMNFAGVFQLPCIFVCENNQYAISVPRKKQTHAETIAQKAIAYGIRSIQVDGNDVFAVYKATKEAVDNARAGKGPTLIETFTYRQADHSTSDDAKRYRTDKEMQEWLKKDPILRLEKYMKAKKLLDDKYKKEVANKTKEQVEKEVEKYENFPAPSPEDIVKYTFAEMNQDLKEQFEEIKNG